MEHKDTVWPSSRRTEARLDHERERMDRVECGVSMSTAVSRMRECTAGRPALGFRCWVWRRVWRRQEVSLTVVVAEFTE